jgi:hypothetical protein
VQIAYARLTARDSQKGTGATRTHLIAAFQSPAMTNLFLMRGHLCGASSTSQFKEGPWGDRPLAAAIRQ